MLSPNKLAALLPSRKLGETLFVFNELPSTNTFALQRAKEAAFPSAVILADRQTAGRGRFNRSWYSPADSNIYGTLLCSLDIPIPPVFWGWVPLMAGVAIAQVLEHQTALQIHLKWPNDLLIAERKVGGILCESLSHKQRKWIVIGFGINVNLSMADFPQELQGTATSLQIECRQPLERDNLITHIITALENGWANLTVEGHRLWLVEYRKRCATLGQMVQVEFSDGNQLKGLAHSIGESGQLNVLPSPSASHEQSARMREIHSGEIVHIRIKDSQ